MIFTYLLLDAGGEQSGSFDLPVLLNIGTQFETATGTYGVHKIIKDPDHILITCALLNTTPWLLGHIEKSNYLAMTKSLPVL